MTRKKKCIIFMNIENENGGIIWLHLFTLHSVAIANKIDNVIAFASNNKVNRRCNELFKENRI